VDGQCDRDKESAISTGAIACRRCHDCATARKGNQKKIGRPGCSRSFGAWSRIIRIPATTCPKSQRGCTGGAT